MSRKLPLNLAFFCLMLTFFAPREFGFRLDEIGIAISVMRVIFTISVVLFIYNFFANEIKKSKTLGKYEISLLIVILLFIGILYLNSYGAHYFIRGFIEIGLVFTAIPMFVYHMQRYEKFFLERFFFLAQLLFLALLIDLLTADLADPTDTFFPRELRNLIFYEGSPHSLNGFLYRNLGGRYFDFGGRILWFGSPNEAALAMSSLTILIINSYEILDSRYKFLLVLENFIFCVVSESRMFIFLSAFLVFLVLFSLIRNHSLSKLFFVFSFVCLALLVDRGAVDSPIFADLTSRINMFVYNLSQEPFVWLIGAGSLSHLNPNLIWIREYEAGIGMQYLLDYGILFYVILISMILLVNFSSVISLSFQPSQILKSFALLNQNHHLLFASALLSVFVFYSERDVFSLVLASLLFWIIFKPAWGRSRDSFFCDYDVEAKKLVRDA